MAQPKTRHVAIYGDIDLNLIDGSSIWLQSISYLFAKHPNTSITLLLKAPVRRDLLLRPLRELEQVRIRDPFAKTLLPHLRNSLSPNQVVKILAQIDREAHIDILVARGRRVVAKIAASGGFAGRLWPYLTDIPQSPTKLTRESETELNSIGEAARYVLCQTEEFRSFVEAWLPTFRGKCILCPPIIQSDALLAPRDRVPPDRKTRLVYLGKFAPAWNPLEIAALPEAFARHDEDIELHVVGDKIHEIGDQPDFADRVKEALERGQGVVWHGGRSRQEAVALAAECDFGLSWRKPELDHSLELSTKVLEYGAVGLPAILNRTSMHEDLLGKDYPLFVGDEAEVLEVVRAAKHDPAVYRLAAQRCADAARRHTSDAIYAKLLPYLEREFPQANSASRCAQRLRVVVASHDLKFFTRIQEHLERLPHVEVRVDPWSGLTDHDVAQSTDCLKWADVIICEWCAANAVWYSRRKRPHQKLYVRFHRFEIDTKFPRKLQAERVDRIVCVSEHYRKLVLTRFAWPEAKVTTIGNWVDTLQLDRPKMPGAQFHIGIIGLAPARKRLDRALDILEQLRRLDPRYILFAKSKMPWEYWWIWKNPEERAYYEEVFARLNGSVDLRDAVVFDPFGADVALWLRKIGFILSTSDDESFHLAPAEGMVSGAIPMVLNWPGAETIYAARWIHASTDEIAHAIHTIVMNSRWEALGKTVREEVACRYALETICARWANLVSAS